jgi:hypothetical protein
MTMKRSHVRVVTMLVALACAAPLLAADLTLAQRVQQIKDREAIRALLIEYAHLLDQQDFVAYSRLFAKQGVWEGNIGSAKGPEEIRKMLDVTFAKIPPGSEHKGAYHILSNILIDVRGDTATSWSRWTWVVPGARGVGEGQRSGHYEDRLVRENGQWRFQHRLTVTELPTPQNDKEAGVWRSDYRTPAAPKREPAPNK